MNMRTILIASLSLVFALGGYAQNGKRAEKIKAFKVAIFSEVLDLTVEEAQNFWPLYNELESKKEALKKEYIFDRNTEGLTDEELETQINRFFEREQRELDLKKSYTERFKKVLPLQKVVKIPKAEKRFKRELLKRMSERKKK